MPAAVPGEAVAAGVEPPPSGHDTASRALEATLTPARRPTVLMMLRGQVNMSGRQETMGHWPSKMRIALVSGGGQSCKTEDLLEGEALKSLVEATYRV